MLWQNYPIINVAPKMSLQKYRIKNVKMPCQKCQAETVLANRNVTQTYYIKNTTS